MPLRDFRAAPLNVLIVDDDVSFAEALRMFLGGDERMNVLGVAVNLREALTHARQGAYDLALVDVRLIEGDGFGVVSALRDLDPKLVSVMMSGLDVDVYRDDAFNAGARAVRCRCKRMDRWLGRWSATIWGKPVRGRHPDSSD